MRIKVFIILLALLSLYFDATAQMSEKFDKACLKLNYGYDVAIAAFEEISNDSNEDDLTRAEATIVLINIYANLGDIENIQKQLKSLKVIYDNRKDKKTLSGVPGIISDYNTYTIERLKQMEAPFSELLSGVWVSAEADEIGCPWLILYIGVTSNNKVWSYIEPHCKFASYMGNNYYSENIVVNSLSIESNLHVYFGDSKYQTNSSKLLSKMSNTFNSISKASSEAVAVRHKDKPLSIGNISGQVAVNVIEGLVQGVITELAVDKTHYYLCDIVGPFGRGEIADDVTIYYSDIYERSDENRTHEYNTIRRLNLFHISEKDSIFFSTSKGTAVAPLLLTSSGLQSLYSTENAKKQIAYATIPSENTSKNSKKAVFSIPFFNEYGYQKLKNKVLTYTRNEDIKKEITYGPLGYGYTQDTHYLNWNKFGPSSLSGAYYRKNGDYMDSPDYYLWKTAFIRINNDLFISDMSPSMQEEIYKKIKNFIPMEEDKRKKNRK